MSRFVDRGTVPEDEVLRDTRGVVVDDAYVDRAVEDAVGKVRGRGRPSLSEAGESPLIRVRVSKDLQAAVDRAVQAAGTSRSEWLRRVLDDATRRAG